MYPPFTSTCDIIPLFQEHNIFVIGLGHRRQVGKDTLASELAYLFGRPSSTGIKRISSPLKHILARFSGGELAYLEGVDSFIAGLGSDDLTCVSKTHPLGRDSEGSTITIRDGLISLGGWARSFFGPNIFVSLWYKDIRGYLYKDHLGFKAGRLGGGVYTGELGTIQGKKCTVIIVPDIRFPEEAQMVKDVGGCLIKVERPGIPKYDDEADSALGGYTGWDLEFVNDIPNISPHWPDRVETLAQRIVTFYLSSKPIEV